jgi:periplasmic protein TonB
MAAPRMAIAVALGLLVTFALFWVMQALIGVEAKLGTAAPPLSVEFVRLRRDTAPPPKEREPPKRDKPEAPPPPPEMNVAKSINPGEATADIVPLVDTAKEVAAATSLSAGSSDSESVPLVRVDPDYPPRALQRGIEGWVDVEFTITPLGTVEDPKILRANPPGVFEQSTLRAVRRWRYNPRIEGGKAVSRTQRTRLSFRLPG